MENLKSCHTTSLLNHLSCNYVSYIIEGHVEWVHKLFYVAILQLTQKVKIWFYFVHFFTFGKLGNKQIMLILRNTFLCKYYYLYRIIKHGQILHWRFSIIVQVQIWQIGYELCVTFGTKHNLMTSLVIFYNARHIIC